MELSVMGYGRFGLSAGRRASGASGRGRTTAPKHAAELAVSARMTAALRRVPLHTYTYLRSVARICILSSRVLFM